MNERLALGTVQFGMNYGVAGAGQVPFAEVGRILALAKWVGIDMLDTAEAYGCAETVLGQVGISDFRLVGKAGRLENVADLSRSVHASLARLRIVQFEAFLLHAPAQLLEDSRLAMALSGLKTAGLVRAVGYSVYEPEELARLLQVMRPDLVQLPACALDARWDAVLPELAAQGVRVHLRSAFLQGLLTLPDTPVWAMRWDGLLAAWREWVMEQSTTPAQAALALALARPVERVVIGVETTSQLADLLDLPTLPNLPTWLTTVDPVLLDPRGWPRT
jgi:aryl-alcohol dehydrogenase-like predicted oxidoreductase